MANLGQGLGRAAMCSDTVAQHASLHNYQMELTLLDPVRPVKMSKEERGRSQGQTGSATEAVMRDEGQR